MTARYDEATMTIGDVLDLSAARWGDRVAIVDDGSRWSYGELRQLALRAANGLAELGVRKGDRVAVWMPNGLDWVTAFFAAVYAGAVVVPLNTALSFPEVEYQVTHSGASVLLVRDSYRDRDYLAEARDLERTADHDLAVVGVGIDSDLPDVIAWTRLLKTGADEDRLPRVEVADPAIMLYTSGTTGRPKGVVHTHRFVATQFAAADRLGLSEADCLVLYLPLFHIYALVAGLILTMLVGARTVLMPRFDAHESLRLIQDERATVVYGIPTTYIDQLSDPSIDDTDFSAVRFALTPFPFDLCQKVRAKFGTVCLNPYGMTETAACVLVAALDDPPELAMRTVGRPLAGIEAKIVDQSTGRTASAGASGVLALRGASIFAKYHDQPDATAAAFDAEGWFLTGDIASMDEGGNVTFIGRNGDSYRVGGEIVDPVEVETAIQSHPDVVRAAAFGIPDERLGEVGQAWVVLRAGSVVTEQDLRVHVSHVLARFKVPREIRFTDEMPTTPSGKVKKFQLREASRRGAAGASP